MAPRKTPTKASKQSASSAEQSKTPKKQANRIVYTSALPTPEQRKANGRFHGRSLVNWNHDVVKDQVLLMAMYDASQNGDVISWARVAHRLKPGATEHALSQHLTRARQRLLESGYLVPPENGAKDLDPEIRGYVLREQEGGKVATVPITYSDAFAFRKCALPNHIKIIDDMSYGVDEVQLQREIAALTPDEEQKALRQYVLTRDHRDSFFDGPIIRSGRARKQVPMVPLPAQTGTLNAPYDMNDSPSVARARRVASVKEKAQAKVDTAPLQDNDDDASHESLDDEEMDDQPYLETTGNDEQEVPPVLAAQQGVEQMVLDAPETSTDAPTAAQRFGFASRNGSSSFQHPSIASKQQAHGATTTKAVFPGHHMAQNTSHGTIVPRNQIHGLNLNGDVTFPFTSQTNGFGTNENSMASLGNQLNHGNVGNYATNPFAMGTTAPRTNFQFTQNSTQNSTPHFNNGGEDGMQPSPWVPSTQQSQQVFSQTPFAQSADAGPMEEFTSQFDNAQSFNDFLSFGN